MYVNITKELYNVHTYVHTLCYASEIIKFFLLFLFILTISLVGWRVPISPKPNLKFKVILL